VTKLISEAHLPIENHGDFTMHVFKNKDSPLEHFALVKKFASEVVPFVRIHSECVTGDVFGSKRCDCGSQLHKALALIAKEGGILIYLRQEGRGIGLANKIKAYALQDDGFDTVAANEHLGFPSDTRDYQVALDILAYFKIKSLRLLTNNPDKIESLKKIIITERIPLVGDVTDTNRKYLLTKKHKMGHLL
jgi:3,4-dihydroxy 2-butanone 4-phosphate synthase / GTP cyclohydrolase II